MAVRVTTVSLVAGKAKEVLSVPVKVSELLTTWVFALAIVKVPVEAVMVKPFMLVAVATPILGVVSVGEVARTMLPEPCTAFPRAVTVPLVGKVKEVAAESVSVRPKFPEKVRVLAALLETPVPPLEAARAVPDQLELFTLLKTDREPRPKFVRAVDALAKSERLLAARRPPPAATKPLRLFCPVPPCKTGKGAP